jgi:hypothetical protein
LHQAFSVTTIRFLIELGILIPVIQGVYDFYSSHPLAPPTLFQYAPPRCSAIARHDFVRYQQQK